MLKYNINEIFYSIQGEGVRAGTANVFVRFSGCNLQCRKEVEGFDCDTEFVSGVKMDLDTLVGAIKQFDCANIVFTGGEPGLQLDKELVEALKWHYIAIETNGTVPLPSGIDWICCSPKTAEHTLRINNVQELKYVRNKGQGIPKPSISADHYLISPAWDADGLHEDNLRHCINLVKDNPTWRLSVQQHKLWGIR